MPTLPALTKRIPSTTRSNWTCVCPPTTTAPRRPRARPGSARPARPGSGSRRRRAASRGSRGRRRARPTSGSVARGTRARARRAAPRATPTCRRAPAATRGRRCRARRPRSTLAEPVEAVLRERACDDVAAADDPVDVERRAPRRAPPRARAGCRARRRAPRRASTRRRPARAAGRAAAQPRPGADDVERRAAGAGELARRRAELAGADAARSPPRAPPRARARRRARTSSRRRRPAARGSGRRPRPPPRRRGSTRARRRAAAAGSRPRRSPSGVALGERVRLVVEDERARPVALEHVEPPVQQHAVVLERERPLGPGARERRDPPRQLRVAVGLDEAPRSAPAPRRSRPDTRRAPARRPARAGAAQVDELEQPVDGVADLGRGEPASARRPVRARRAGRIPATRSA